MTDIIAASSKGSSIKLREYPNMGALKQVISSPRIDSDLARQLLMYYFEADKNVDEAGNNYVDVTLAKKLFNKVPYGRLIPNKYCCSSMPSMIRAEVFGEWHDIDIVNCGPSILVHLCDELKIDPGYIMDFWTDRNKFYDDLRITPAELNAYNEKHSKQYTARDIGKKIYTAILYSSRVACIYKDYGVKITNERCPLYKKFVASINHVTKKLVENDKFSKLVSDLKAAGKTKDASILSIIIHEEEQSLVNGCMEALESYSPSAYMYDGFLIKGDAQIELDDLNGVYPYIQFIIKPHKHIFDSLTIIKRNADQIARDWELVSSGKVALKNTIGRPSVFTASTDLDAANLFLAEYRGRFVKVSADKIFILDPENRYWMEGFDALIAAILNMRIQKEAAKGTLVAYSENLPAATKIADTVLKIAPVDDEFVVKNNAAIKNYLYYKNGVFSFRDKMFYSYDDPKIPSARPFIIIDHEVHHLEFDDLKVQKIMNLVFGSFESEIIRDRFLTALARAVSGNYSDKFFGILPGPRNSGKGTISDSIAYWIGPNYTRTVFPVAASLKSKDTAAENRIYLSARHDIARVAFADEAASADGRPIKMDGTAIKKIIASGGDKVEARRMRENESFININTISFFNVNQIPKSDPLDAMETAILFPTGAPYEDIREDNAFAALAKPLIDNVKELIRADVNGPSAFLAIMAHYWSDFSFKKNPAISHELIKQEKKDLGIIATKLSDVMNDAFIISKTGDKGVYVLEDTVYETVIAASFTTSKSKLEKTLLANLGIKLGQKTIDKERKRVYWGLQLRSTEDSVESEDA